LGLNLGHRDKKEKEISYKNSLRPNISLSQFNIPYYPFFWKIKMSIKDVA
jgi:hypothetical protein